MSKKSDRPRLYVECSRCGERFAVATLPTSIETAVRSCKSAVCPNCGEAYDLRMLPTVGKGAVTEPRHGSDAPNVPDPEPPF